MRKGQITILVLLLGLMGLTVALSSASRSLSDLKQVSYVDFGTKAFAAAEAGLQFGLSQFDPNTIYPVCPNGTIVTVNNPPTGISQINYQICQTSTQGFAVFANDTNTGVGQDNVIQLDLSTIKSNNTKGVDVLWKNNASAIEVIDIDGNNVITRYAFNGTNTNYQGFQGKISANSTVNCTTDTGFNTGSATSNSVGLGAISVSKQHKLLRVKALGNSTDIAVCARVSGGTPDLGTPQFSVIATATTTNNTVKKVQAVKTPPTMPSIFDYVLFSNSSISKN